MDLGPASSVLYGSYHLPSSFPSLVFVLCILENFSKLSSNSLIHFQLQPLLPVAVDFFLIFFLRTLFSDLFSSVFVSLNLLIQYLLNTSKKT